MRNPVRKQIKPLSVNKAWQGKRFKTRDYDLYTLELKFILPNSLDFPKKNIRLTLTFGFSNKAFDIDNPLKPLIDVLQKLYDFDDKEIYELHVKKKIVKKGEEFIEFYAEEITV